MAEAGYDWIICEAEQDPAKADPLTYARKGRAPRRHGLEGRRNSPNALRRGGRIMPTQIHHFIGGKPVPGRR